MDGPWRLAVLISHPIQYYAPLFRELAARDKIELTVYYCSDHGVREVYDEGFGVSFRWDSPLLDGYRSVFLRDHSLRPGVNRLFGHFNPQIVREVLICRYDAVLIHGYAHLTDWIAFAACKCAGTPILLHGESHLLNPRSWIRRLAKQMLLRPLFSLAHRCLYIGTHNQVYYQHYGVRDEKLVRTPYSVDNNFFQSGEERCQEERLKARDAFGISGDTAVILYAGKLIALKQPLLLLEAFRNVAMKHRAALVYAGDGEFREAVKSRAREYGLHNVHITGFLNQREMRKAYRAADVLVLPSSRESWGLVVNEAMNFGLPIVVSDQVGCAPDLVKPGENGYIVPYADVGALSGALTALVESPEMRERFGRKSKEIIARWGIRETADGIIEALRGVPSGGRA